MAKIARSIAHAFTKGRKSAPAEFRELENQLYSLSAVLVAFKDICGPDFAAVTIDPAHLPARFQNEDQNGAHTVSRMLDSCRETLKHLEKIVHEYGPVSAPTDPSMPRLRRWNTDLVRNYKKIAWTTEAGDLATLRSQLMVHTNSLDLVLGIIMSSRTLRIEDSLKEHSNMVKDIHTWWAQNIRDAANVRTEPALEKYQSVEPQSATSPLFFEVHYSSNDNSQLLCAQACLHDDWKDVGSVQIFVCKCNQTETSVFGSRHPRVEKIALSPLCFPFRQAGDTTSWTLFKALDKSTNQMVSITIKNVAASDIVEFETSFIQPLAEARAGDMVLNGLSNQLAHLSISNGRIRALNLHSNLKSLHSLITSVTFQVGHRSLSKLHVNGLTLVNYRELGHQNAHPVDSALDHAELSIYYDNQGMTKTGDITKTIVHLNQASILKADESNACVVIEGVECLGFNQELQLYRLEKADVALHVTSQEGSKTLHQELKDMRRELLITSLRYPRPDETVVLHLQATEVQCEVAIISDAELLITRSQQNKYRLIVTSRNRCTVLSQILPDTFFTAPPTRSPSFSSPTWVVQVQDGGKREMAYYPNGFRFLSFQSSNAEKMFELGRSVVIGATPVQTLSLE
ncbi:hypothetical protein N658DRAFT_498272 [Parathielavia hyrcaniae]|uniref:Uncharacterized protein n=1 Tax=Parathielavia hyrcaniae TaxID=113614 RepID=A0AAN6T0G5_9PEZI|nr:hypothetical protein N658DRAFT_498272 [Parathielavia hyrcaniae]